MSPVHVSQMSPVQVLQMSPVQVLQMSPVHVLQMSPVQVLQVQSSPAFTTYHGRWHGRKCGLRIADCGLRTTDCGLRTADCGVRRAEKTECGGVHNFILTNFNINFCFLCQNMYFKYNMEYG